MTAHVPPSAIARRAGLALVLLLAVAAGSVHAQEQAAEGCEAAVDPGADRSDWTRVLAPKAGFVLDLPPGTSLSGSGSMWYVMLHDADGNPQLPGMDVTRLAGRTLQEAREEIGFPSDAEARSIAMGPGTRGLCVTATYETEMEGRYQAWTYLAEGDDAVYVMRLWESLAWPPYDAVARSFTLVRTAGPFPPEE